MAERGLAPWPELPPEPTPSPGTRAWMVLRRLRDGGWLRPRRLGCLLLVLAILVFTALWALGAAINGITARFGPEPVQGSPFDPVAPTGPESSRAPAVDLISEGTLIVAVPEGFRPAESSPGPGNRDGFELALLDRIADDLGVPAVDTGKRTSAQLRVGMLNRGEADLALVEISPQQPRTVGIAGPYLMRELRLAVPADSPVTRLAAIGNGEVCAPRDSPAAAALAARIGERLATRSSLGACADLLGHGVEAIAADHDMLAALRTTAGTELRVLDEPVGSTRYGIGVPPGDELLRQRINEVLRAAIADGTWTRLYERYLGVPAPMPPAIR